MIELILAAALAGTWFSQQLQVRTESQQVPDARGAESTPRHPRHDPWGGLFIQQPAGPAVVAPSLAMGKPMQAQQSSTERGPCNMPIVRANPDVDPKMVIPHRAGDVEAKIRVIEPTVCGK